MGSSIEDALKGLRFVMAIALVAFFAVRFLFFGTRGVSKFIRPFAWTVLLAVGLWYLHEWQRPDYYLCEACGLEYTCEDEEGREPHGYCEKTASHKHHGAVVKRYDSHRGMAQVMGWMRSDEAPGKGAFSADRRERGG